MPKQEIKKTNTFTMAPKRIKYLGIHLPKEVKDSDSKLQNTAKSTKEDTWKETLCLWVGRLSIVQKPI